MADGTPYSAAMHYSHSEHPFCIYFSTDITSKKCEPLVNNDSVQASVVIGLSEEKWITLQLTGQLRIIKESEKLTPEAVASIKSVHYAKHPASAKYADDPDTVFLEFSPSWWRYTDFNQKPAQIIESK
jgi:general stress protein 26